MKIDFKKGNNLIPVIIQDYQDKTVLMLGFTNRQAYHMTEKTAEVYLYSRKNKKLWHKGATSGNILKLKKMLLDCDGDTLIYQVALQGKFVCHLKRKSCFETVQG